MILQGLLGNGMSGRILDSKTFVQELRAHIPHFFEM